MKTTKTRPGQKIKLTSVQELLGVSNEETALDLEVEKIRSFKNHPFKVVDDEKMQDLVESIRVTRQIEGGRNGGLFSQILPA